MNSTVEASLASKRGNSTRQPPKRSSTAVTYPPEPTYVEPIENHTQATERDRKIRNQQL